MRRIVFLPDRPVDRPGDIFRPLVAELGIERYEVDGDPAAADFVAFVGRERAAKHFGRRVRSGRIDETTYVLPSTAPELRAKFFEGHWRAFAAHVLGRDLAVRDEYKGMAPDAIKAALDRKRHPFAVCAANIVYDINLGTIVRCANAFLAREVWIYGRRKTDLRGAMGAQNYETLVHVPDAAAFADRKRARGYTAVCFEETADAVPLPDLAWPPNPLMIFGQEGPGVPDDLRALADVTTYIPLFGSMRSINVGVAAGIAMHHWCSKGKGSRGK